MSPTCRGVLLLTLAVTAVACGGGGEKPSNPKAKMLAVAACKADVDTKGALRPVRGPALRAAADSARKAAAVDPAYASLAKDMATQDSELVEFNAMSKAQAQSPQNKVRRKALYQVILRIDRACGDLLP